MTWSASEKLRRQLDESIGEICLFFTLITEKLNKFIESIETHAYPYHKKL